MFFQEKLFFSEDNKNAIRSAYTILMNISEKAPYAILYEDNNIIAVYKKKDVFTIRTADKKTFAHNLYHYLKDRQTHRQESLFIVHRLDYETSGILIFAKSYAMKEKLQKCFEERDVGRFYEGVVPETLPSGKEFHVTHYLKEEGLKVSIGTPNDGKEALTDITVANRIQIGTVLAIRIRTGRRNQIRIALQSLGFPLLGDIRYGGKEAKRLYLNEYRLAFPKSLGLGQTVFEISPLWLKE